MDDERRSGGTGGGRLPGSLFGFSPLHLALAASLSGCANWAGHGVSPQAPRRIRAAVLPVRIGVKIRRLKSLGKQRPPGIDRDQERALARSEMEAVAKRLRIDVQERLGNSYVFDVLSATITDRACGGLEDAAPGEAECLRRLRQSAQADVALRITLSGYGSVKKRWIAYLIGTGVLEGAAKGVALAFAGAGTWAAVGIAAGETAQEAATWGGGSYLFGRFLSPVILDGALLSTEDGAKLTRKTALAVRNRKALKRFSRKERRDRALRLKLAGQAAVEELISELEGTAWRQLARLRKRSLGGEVKASRPLLR